MSQGCCLGFRGSTTGRSVGEAMEADVAEEAEDIILQLGTQLRLRALL